MIGRYLMFVGDHILCSHNTTSASNTIPQHRPSSSTSPFTTTYLPPPLLQHTNHHTHPPPKQSYFQIHLYENLIFDSSAVPISKYHWWTLILNILASHPIPPVMRCLRVSVCLCACVCACDADACLPARYAW